MLLHSGKDVRSVNTNIISIDLGTLQSAAANVATGDAVVCGKCRAMLSSHDSLGPRLLQCAQHGGAGARAGERG